MARLLKYMGTADVRIIEKGDDFDGRHADGLSKTVTWNKDNHWVVDAEELGLSDDDISFIVEHDGFKDVTDLKRVPDNEHQKIFLPRGGQAVSVPLAEIVKEDGEEGEDTAPDGVAGNVTGSDPDAGQGSATGDPVGSTPGASTTTASPVSGASKARGGPKA